MLKVHRTILIIIAAALCIVPATAFVERSVTSSDADGIITVTLTFPEGTIGGMTEDIPPGFEFVATEHPADQTMVDGNRVHFAIICEEKVVYSLKGKGTPQVTGRWIDLLSEDEDAVVQNHNVPGFGVLAGCTVIAGVMFLRRGN